MYFKLLIFQSNFKKKRKKEKEKNGSGKYSFIHFQNSEKV